MAIPDFQTIMLPLLQYASDGREHTVKEAREALAGEFKLTDAERTELLPSGRQPTFDNRFAWAKTYLQRSGLLDSPRRGHFRITERGLAQLKKPPDRITIHFLEQFPEFEKFRSIRKEKNSVLDSEERTQSDADTPEETLESAYSQFRSSLADELLNRVKQCSPQFFENLVLELLLKMGYGGSRAEAAKAIGRSGDEGIDGIINEDRLGLDVIYLQAKRWNGTVGRPEIQRFVGALHGKRAKKGVFITTGSFSAEAKAYVTHIEPKVILIDGEQFSDLLIDFNVGVTPVAAYEIKRIDLDYFSEE